MTSPHSPLIPRHTLGRQERIKSRKLVEELFEGGKSQSVTAFPLRAVWKTSNDSDTLVSPLGDDMGAQAQILVSVSKRHFKRAVKRNRVKRQIREAYRLNKQILTPSTLHLQPSTLYLAFIWQADELYPTSVVEDRMKTLLHRIAEKL